MSRENGMTAGGIFGGASIGVSRTWIGVWCGALLRALAAPCSGQYTGHSFELQRTARVA